MDSILDDVKRGLPFKRAMLSHDWKVAVAQSMFPYKSKKHKSELITNKWDLISHYDEAIDIFHKVT